MNYAGAGALTPVGPYKKPDILTRLQERKAVLESELAEISEAIDAINANPAVNQILSTITRVNLY